MERGMCRAVMRSAVVSLIVLLWPCISMGYIMGDINSDNKIDLRESIYSLRVAAGSVTPLSGTTINVPGDIPTIQQAIDAASSGDTISIAAGTYSGSLTIDGKILALSGAGSASTILDGGGVNAITIKNSPGVSIENLTVQNGIEGIYALSNSHVEISQVVVKDCTDRGIQIDNNSNGKITNSTIQNSNQDGIGVLRNSNVYIAGSVTTKDNKRHGLYVFQGSAALIDGSTFTSTGNVNRGISVDFNANLFVSNSVLTLPSNQGQGLKADHASSIGIMNDSTVLVENSGKVGVAAYGSSQIYSEGAITVRGAARMGIEISGSAAACLLGNVLIENCGGEGFSVGLTSSAIIGARLEVSNCVTAGISVYLGSTFMNNDSANVIVKNIITGTDPTGISVYENSIYRASGGTLAITDNSYAGFDVGRNSTLSLRERGVGLNATISRNGTGIILWQQSALRSDKTISVTANTGDGINLSSGATARIKNMTVQNNGAWGINAEDGASINVSGATITTNHGGGNNDIALLFGARSTLRANTIGTPLVCDSSALSRTEDASANSTCP